MTTETPTIVVTGATGTIGRHVVEALARREVKVRAVSRRPEAASPFAGADLVPGDVSRPETLAPALDGADALHLISIAGDDYTPLATADEVVARAQDVGVRRVTVLTGTDDELAVADAAERSGLEWTHVRPVELMGNKRQWADAVRAGEPVLAPFARTPHALVHEADVGAVIAAALLGGHGGRTYTPTGPEALSPVEAASTIGDVVGRPVELVEQSVDEARDQMRAGGLRDDVIDEVIEYGLHPPASAAAVTDVVERVTGVPPRRFAQWVEEHREAFATSG